jgi:predicted signal transduction protein with EAL and GGDEF domain
MGDVLLQQVAQRLTTCVRAGDTVARLGGDEFVVMLASLSMNEAEAASQTEAIGEKIVVALNRTYQLRDVAYHSTPSIGATLFSGHQTEIDVLLKQADLAMYKAKEAGRNTLRFFDPEMERVVTIRAALEDDLRQAIQERQFLLHYQPQMVGGQLAGSEALVRWQHPKRGMVSPAEFIPLAEETGLILPLGHWVLQTACSQLASWATRPGMAHLTVAVNVSADQFRQDDFVYQVLSILKQTGADPQRLKLELTESLLVSNVEEVIDKMFALKAKGVGFALDDFGTGYSSLSYLKRLPLDQLKIDQSFVRDVLTDANDASIARTGWASSPRAWKRTCSVNFWPMQAAMPTRGIFSAGRCPSNPLMNLRGRPDPGCIDKGANPCSIRIPSRSSANWESVPTRSSRHSPPCSSSPSPRWSRRYRQPSWRGKSSARSPAG